MGLRQLLQHQWQGQQHPLCPMESVVAAEPHPTEPKLLVLLDPEGAIITAVMTEEALEHTVRGGVVVVAVAQEW